MEKNHDQLDSINLSPAHFDAPHQGWLAHLHLNLQLLRQNFRSSNYPKSPFYMLYIMVCELTFKRKVKTSFLLGLVYEITQKKTSTYQR